jgi:hypothetical protein
MPVERIKDFQFFAVCAVVKPTVRQYAVNIQDQESNLG